MADPPTKLTNRHYSNLVGTIMRNGKDSPQAQALIGRIVGHPDHSGFKLRKAIDRGTHERASLLASKTKQPPRAARARTKKMPVAKKAPKQKTVTGRSKGRRTTTPGPFDRPELPPAEDQPSHRIQDQSPSASFDLVIDETGDGFFSSDKGKKPGRIVGIVSETGLAPKGGDLRGYHAKENPALCAQVVNEVLAAQMGILGLTMPDLEQAPGERWMAAVLEVIAWTCRLLPLAEQTRLRVFVEERGEFDSNTGLAAACHELLRQLGEQEPHRAEKLHIDAAILSKGGHLLSGHADALAYAWQRAELRPLLERAGLLGPCLHEGDLGQWRRLWLQVSGPGQPDPDTWRQVVAADDAQSPGSIPALLLDRLGERVQQDKAGWQRLVEACLEHLESKAIDLRALGRQADWLAAWQPAEAELPDALRLAWLSAQLERANHLGEVGDAIAARIEPLAQRLWEEQPRLVCQADLVRAVLATNRFEFQAAGQALARWLDQPPAVPGLQHWARVRSSLGQHAAFEGRHEQAEALFREALDAFARLSDPHLARLEQAQTSAYRASAAMDDPATPDDRARELVARVTPLDPAALARLAADPDPASKYAHHLALRYLAHRGTAAERQAYLAAKARFSSGWGHPWPLIHAYRALLLRPLDPDAALEQLEQGVDLALAGASGPLVRLIGATLAAIGVGWGSQRSQVQPKDLDELARHLPAAQGRIDLARTALARPGSQDPLGLLRAILPFNFR